MATSYYSTGTVSLTNGSPVVTGVGTLWQTALITNGFLFIEAAEGNPLPIASVDSDSQITAELEWTGATGTYSYALLRQPDQLQDNAENSRALSYLLSELRNGTIFKYDMSGTLADRALYNERPKGFSYLVLSGSNAQLYVKASATSGDWAGPFAYGAGPVGPMGPAGFVNFRGTYAAGSTYVRNDAVYHNGSSWVALQTTTGNAPPNLPTTSNAYWSLLAIKGQDGTGIGDMLKSVYDPQNRQLPFATIGDASLMAGFRNKIINGDFSVIQRGNNLNASTGQYMQDRWRRRGGGGTLSASQQAFANGQVFVPDNNGTFGRYIWTTASGASLAIEQRVENVRTLTGRVCTLTFYAKADGAKTIYARLAQEFGSGGSPSVNLPWQPVVLSSNWVRFDLVLTLPTIAGTTIGPADALVVQFDVSGDPFGNSGSISQNIVLDLARVSLVEGDATAEADPFAPRHPQQELALCQRYYWRGLAGAAFNQFTTGTGQAASWHVAFPVTMRATPTLSSSGLAGHRYTPNFSNPTPDGGRLIGTSSTAADNTSNVTVASNGYLDADAEL